jgi:hypothetical protein
MASPVDVMLLSTVIVGLTVAVIAYFAWEL